MNSQTTSCDDSFNRKMSISPKAPRLNKRRMIRTSLENDYVKSVLLNHDVKFELKRGLKTTIDCREVNSESSEGCLLNKVPTLRNIYSIRKLDN
mmetsp:Transcript_1452/g.1400  ORF Transcript_1452/g.1400 Transcript_1452/m.1400 type:complete len:94 (-) Transcript_1452:62-343(-)